MSEDRAFTLVELIFVIVVIGILAAVLIPRMQGSRLREAADQVVSHIRYTQHLAMMDDKFDPNNAEWYKGRWQIIFGTSVGYTKGKIAYSIFSDRPTYTGNPDISEMAKNPQSPDKLLSGGFAGILNYSTSKNVTRELNIGEKYGISNIVFSPSCSVSSSERIAFDYLGRPMKGNVATYASPYPTGRLITDQCNITLFDGSGSAVITIEPETGFARVIPF